MQLHGLDATSLALLLAACFGVLSFLYLQARPARRVVVSALALWDELGEGTVRRRAWSRERRVWWALLLSCAIASALAIALGDPQAPKSAPRDVLVAIDASPSMGARDAAGTRLERAKELARAELRALGAGDHAWIVALGAQASVLTPRTSDQRLLHDAVARVRLSPPLRSDFTELARSLLAGAARAELVLISDGALSENTVRALSSLRVASRHLRVGQSARNAAVTQLSARAYPLDHAHQEVWVRVESFGEREEPALLRVSSEGVLLHEARVLLRAGAAETRLLGDLPRAASKLRAELRLERGGDALPEDDAAELQLPSTPPMNVLVVSRGNRYLEAALQLDDMLVVDTQTPEQYRTCSGHALVIFDAALPSEPPACAALYFAPSDLAGAFPLARRGLLTRPYFDHVDASAALTRDLALADVNVGQAARVELGPTDRALVTSATRAPLLVEGSRDDLPFVAFTFDLRDSDLPLRTAFPLLFLRTLDQLGRRSNGDVSSAALHTHDSAIAPRRVLADSATSSAHAPFALPWSWLLAAALALLAFEWFSFHRGWTP